MSFIVWKIATINNQPNDSKIAINSFFISKGSSAPVLPAIQLNVFIVDCFFSLNVISYTAHTYFAGIGCENDEIQKH